MLKYLRLFLFNFFNVKIEEKFSNDLLNNPKEYLGEKILKIIFNSYIRPYQVIR